MKRRNFIKNISSIGLFSAIAPRNLIIGKRGEPLWHVEQFKDAGLAHFSYAVLVDNRVVIIDPAREAQQYYDFAEKNNAYITGVIETHPHADFASAHLEIADKKNAVIYVSSLTKAKYPYKSFDDGNTLFLNKRIVLKSLYTPGHAPDHISVILQQDNKDIAVFSGDSLLIGDVGRPDLRDYDKNNIQAQRRKLAGMMYTTIHEKFAKLPDDVIVYPAHGAGSLCGKAMRDAPSSTIGYEKKNNYAFKNYSKDDFIELLLKDLSFIPKYFPFDVNNNIKGFPELSQSLNNIKNFPDNFQPDENDFVVDTRDEENFKNSYLTGAINIQQGTKFETWLGSVIIPGKEFYLTGMSKEQLSQVVLKAANIGYERYIKGVFVYNSLKGNKFPLFNADNFSPDNNDYTIIDVRTENEFKEKKILKNSINIPLEDLIGKIGDIPRGKPILVHCASGYRSAAASSIIKKFDPGLNVFDFGKKIKNISKE